jgi:hypothetical protein
VIASLLNYITDSWRTALTSITGAAVGQISLTANVDFINTAFQHAAWSVAIIAGIMTVINLFFPLRSFYDSYKSRKDEKKNTE